MSGEGSPGVAAARRDEYNPDNAVFDFHAIAGPEAARQEYSMITSRILVEDVGIKWGGDRRWGMQRHRVHYGNSLSYLNEFNLSMRVARRPDDAGRYSYQNFEDDLTSSSAPMLGFLDHIRRIVLSSRTASSRPHKTL